MEYSAIIGYVTVNGDCDDSTSVWAVPVEHQWHIEDAYIFDEPIRGIKGKLNLFETPEIDENNLPPAHKLVRRVPRLEGDCLVVPLTESSLDDIVEDGLLHLGVTDEVVALLEKPIEEQTTAEDVFKDVFTVRLESPTRTMTFEVAEMGYWDYQLEDGSSLKAINWNMEEINYFDMVFKLKK